jgi:nitrate reductase gamma subunit
MMEWLEWARGPAFIFSFTLMVLGLARNVFLTIFGIIRALNKAGDKTIPWKNVLRMSVSWMMPIRKLKERFWYSIASISFHIGVIIVPIFLIEHIALWRSGIGFGLPAVSNSLADIFTLTAIFMIFALLIGRVINPNARALSRAQDFILLLMLLIPFAAGFIAAHPVYNPFNYNAVMLIHVLGSNLVMCLLPFTKLCHCVLMPFTQIVSEVGWHFPPHAGDKAAESIGREVDAV